MNTVRKPHPFGEVRESGVCELGWGITPAQLKQIQMLFSEKNFDREERLFFMCEFFRQDIKSTKDLTKLQAVQLIQALKNQPITENTSFALFDKNNPQHRTILSRCYELGWV